MTRPESDGGRAKLTVTEYRSGSADLTMVCDHGTTSMRRSGDQPAEAEDGRFIASFHRQRLGCACSRVVDIVKLVEMA